MAGRLYIDKEDDRLAVAAILVKNKYTVRQGSRQRKGTKSYDYYLEFAPNADQKQHQYDVAQEAAPPASQEVLAPAT